MMLSEHIRRIAGEVYAAGRSITFLGTGPSTPIRSKKGKSRRMNTCSLIRYEGKSYLIDINKTVDPPSDFEYLLITHTHSDAFGGFSRIKDQEFVFAIPKGLKVKAKEDPWEKQKLEVGSVNKVGDLKVTPFRVKHDIIYGYPTFGYEFRFSDGYLLTYASDMVGVPKESEKYFDRADMVVADGAGWKSNLATHFGVFPFLDLVEEKGWDMGKIYFTQIGRPVPDYKKAQSEMKAHDKRAILTYDGMRVLF